MNRKLVFKLLLFLLLTLIVLGLQTETAEAGWKYCYKNETPIPMKNGSVDMDQVRELLGRYDLPEFLNGDRKLPINVTILYHRHFVVYGSPFGQKDGKTSCGHDAYRYMGYSLDGQAVSDHEFRPDFTAVPEKTKNSQWLRFPWSHWDVLDKFNNYATTMPNPKKDSLYATDAERAADLDRAVDVFELHLNDGRGRFVEQQYFWCLNADGSWMEIGIRNGKCGQSGRPPGIVLTGENLVKFSVIHTRASTYSPGNFTMYSKTVPGYCGAKNICYSTYMIPPLVDIFDINNDASVDLILGKTVLKDEDLTGTIVIGNKWDMQAPLTIEAPCDTTKTQGKAQCGGTDHRGGIMIRSEDQTSFQKSKFLPFNPLNADGNLKLPLDVSDIMPNKSGKYTIEVWIPQYADHDGLKETNIWNNYVKKSFDYEVGEENASVGISGKTNYTILDKLTNEITVYNNTLVPISGDTTISLLDYKGNYIRTLGTFSYNALGVLEKTTFNLSDLGVKLDGGSYFIEAKIPHYPNEKTYDDNTARVPISVGLFVPENTKCKSITTDFVSILPYNGEKPGITRSCIGWTPNFPSTRIEGGQGTYFYFAYRIFPTPMPAYSVTTHDALGLSQSFQLEEPTEKLGACDYRKDDAACDLYEPFLYYPAKWENRFGTDPLLKEFVGPYTVGPHEFYHYRYRGRMLPQQITFHYDIIDMEGNNSNIPLAFGEIIYDVPDDCYYSDVIDIIESCRSIEFYVPIDEATKNRTLPKDARDKNALEERIRFYNPGEHTFRVEVDEKQMYLYQVDEGEEWQGKEKVYRRKWMEPEPKTEIEVKEPKYVEIHRYDEGVYDGDVFDPSTNLGAGNWCVGYQTCGFPSDGVRMTETYEYDRDGYKGTLVQITEEKNHVLTEGKPSDYRYYANRKLTGDGTCYEAIAQVGPDKGQMKTYCDTNGAGYDYMQRGVFKKSNGEVYFSGWRAHSQGVLFPGWEANLHTEHPEFVGYEWKRYQILGGWVYPVDAEEPTITPQNPVITETLEYAIGPVKTHTLKTLPHGEIEWVNQDEFKNHCYSEEDAFSKYGEWNKEQSTFKEKDSPAIVCFHNHGDDFHYWKFDWSKVRKFGVNLKDPFGADKGASTDKKYNGLIFP